MEKFNFCFEYDAPNCQCIGVSDVVSLIRIDMLKKEFLKSFPCPFDISSDYDLWLVEYLDGSMDWLRVKCFRMIESPLSDGFEDYY